ncbi:hypothetical protein GQF42_29235 [Streptomyces broussonetiae]|uniref:Uncharacterized protein n=1 Tax=Streptomyces broussonetiae TaxID=2686304 RepID=A0A6I6N2D4_9ACTN|nr:hypothetical protein [Streptomyces broussonetiae]QHA06833.1 hypothetical protein GQF42_29235 [Streptomyces broussonetiae]
MTFEIRVICDPADTDRVATALNAAFDTGAVRDYPTRDGKRRRLYVTADHRSPCPDLVEHERARNHAAYIGAPDQRTELDWLIAESNAGRCDRNWWLRRAALADRFHPDEQAVYVARALIALDGADVTDNPRDYVRKQYARWITCVCDGIGEGSCPRHPSPDHEPVTDSESE